MGWLSRKKPEPVRSAVFCKDCRWIRPDTYRLFDAQNRLEHAKCGNPNSIHRSSLYLVTGSEEAAIHCTVERGPFGNNCCGPEGRWFEPMYIDLEAVHTEVTPVLPMIRFSRDKQKTS